VQTSNIYAAIYDFLRIQSMATISTIDKNGLKPESALIAFAETSNLEIIFETFYATRKYENLQYNKNVALVVGWDMVVHRTLQYEGIAEPIPPQDVARYRSIFLRKKTPCTEQFLLDPRVRLFKIRPLWISYSDYTSPKPHIIELTFNN
jgi:general stress protein 26